MKNTSTLFDLFRRDKEKQASRLKKKLLLYFLLVAIVSVSVSAQIILEMSSGRFRTQIVSVYVNEAKKSLSTEAAAELDKVSPGVIKRPLGDLRNRMILMLIVVMGSIFGALTLFVRDIVVPMDGLVEATKRIAAGDLNAHAPVMSEDEIGQLAELVNDMNINMQDMITQVRRELDNYNVQLAFAVSMIGQVLEHETTDDALKNKKMKLGEFKRILDLNRSVESILDKMNEKINYLHSFMSTYTKYTISSAITQKEIDETLSHYR